MLFFGVQKKSAPEHRAQEADSVCSYNCVDAGLSAVHTSALLGGNFGARGTPLRPVPFSYSLVGSVSLALMEKENQAYFLWKIQLSLRNLSLSRQQSFLICLIPARAWGSQEQLKWGDKRADKREDNLEMYHHQAEMLRIGGSTKDECAFAHHEFWQK